MRLPKNRFFHSRNFEAFLVEEYGDAESLLLQEWIHDPSKVIRREFIDATPTPTPSEIGHANRRPTPRLGRLVVPGCWLDGHIRELARGVIEVLPVNGENIHHLVALRRSLNEQPCSEAHHRESAYSLLPKIWNVHRSTLTHPLLRFFDRNLTRWRPDDKVAFEQILLRHATARVAKLDPEIG